MQPVASQFTQQIEALKVLIVNDEATVRKVTRSLLQVIQAMAPRNTYP
jgi:PleD family two-component response regulator